MNDKVVVFDRVRENLHGNKRESLYDLLNRAVNETLPRTVMTGSTTLACLLALLIFGGEVIRPFSWVLTFGIIIGALCSVSVGSPLRRGAERKWRRHGGGWAAVGSRSLGSAPPAREPRAPAGGTEG